jgi:hypothetical protein
MALDDNLAGVSRNGKHSPRRPRIELTSSAATPAEAAAIAAAIEQFLRDTAPPPRQHAEQMSPWLRAGLVEGVGKCSDTPWG